MFFLLCLTSPLELPAESKSKATWKRREAHRTRITDPEHSSAMPKKGKKGKKGKKKEEKPKEPFVEPWKKGKPLW